MTFTLTRVADMSLIEIDMADRAPTERQVNWLVDVFMRHSQFVTGRELYRSTNVPNWTALARRGLLAAFNLTYENEFFVLTEAGRAYIEAHRPFYVELRRQRAGGDEYAWGGSPDAEAVYDRLVNARRNRSPPGG